ncbi:uncharacterized protein CCOS01_06212 [Colletotrichum costaricense]|uniref:FAD dependent oxidoreductase domain-containing protein n=1 Tax=Colletotrichum costaricense TaxID=1209916 RepID=A0AAI9YYU9_9PEZI|nr:uncharacterized protein CCOS01_06212 [Colletotrichum costaricense]KAK1528378.1 hypothetical protein CCOS01_06212 [Colletotrichum costaricense]
MSSTSRNDPILIVGAGAFGLSTTVHLLRAGFKDITVIDKDDDVPSAYSAANDLNKIVRAEYEDDFHRELTLKAIDAWKTPLFAPHFHQVGFINACTPVASKEAVNTMNRFRASAERSERMRHYVKSIDSKKDLEAVCWQYQNSPFPGWHGYFNGWSGYANSGAALRTVYNAAKVQGVKFILGSAGTASEVVYQGSGSQRKAIGVRTPGGLFYPAKLVIIAAGAAAGKLVPDIGSDLVAKSWSVAHIELTDDETAELRGIPVTYARDLGFFFEPDPKTNLLKLCPMGGGYVNTDSRTGISIPPAFKDSQFLPKGDELQLRELLRQTFPRFADRPFVRNSLCWFADTADSNFIIDYVPNTSSSLVMLSGDSGHGFKFFPIFGSFVKDLIDNESGKQTIEQWRWKAGEQKSGNWGEEVSWRLGKSREFIDILPNVEAKL